jgi:hypothetical protein
MHVYVAPRDGAEISEKTSRILGFFDFSSFEIPPKTPLLKGGCCRMLSDENVHPSEGVNDDGPLAAQMRTRGAIIRLPSSKLT